MSSSYVIFSAQYPPHMGGIENFTYNLAHALVSSGNTITVVTNDTDSLGSGVKDDEGVCVLRLPCLPFVDGRFPITKHGAEARKLWEWLMTQDVDGVLVNARFYLHSLAGMKFAYKKGLKPIVLDHGSAYLSFSNKLLDPFVRVYERMITALGKQYHPAYYGISQKSSDWLGEFGIKANGVIPNAIDARAYRAQSSCRDFRSELGLNEKSIMIAFVGRFIPEKGIGTIIEASRSRKLINAGAVFILAGDGPMAEEVIKSQSQTLRWVGRLTAPDVSALFLQSDLLCLPSRSEGFSTTLLEAAACCCPAVVTDVGGARELIPDRQYGIILQSAEARDVEEAVFWLSKHADRLAEQKIACRSLVEANYSWSETVMRLEDAFSHAKR